VLLRPIKETGVLLLELIGVDRIIIGPLLADSRVRVVWPLLRVAKKKRYRYFTGANLS
jgi:hypothetical protein